MAIESVKIACQDLMDRAEEIIPETESIFGINVELHIPTMTDRSDSIPSLKVTVEAYPKRVAIEKILNIYEWDV